ncbi:hypothetical protein [Chromobacterium violaceum]|uniref:hypothetical protein n=1 Tax=Chromobacterium violaceum TaxID=536 RepID=UPI0012D2F8D3|nr:hypothetical protein [Chromobacterium violaceum]
MKSIHVTFDSNIWESILIGGKLKEHSEKEALSTILLLIQSKMITPYISDVIITLESIRKLDRKRYHKDITIKTTLTPSAESDTKTDIAKPYKITLTPQYDHHTGLCETLLVATRKALELGFTFINAPRIGSLRLDEKLYKPIESNEEELSERLARSNEAILAFEKEGLGSYQVYKLGLQAIENDPGLSKLGPYRAFSHGKESEKELAQTIAEWADGDALAAHYAHKHDFFCTLDSGKSAGSSSVLHHSRRKWLQENFGIKIVTPKELVQHILENCI